MSAAGSGPTVLVVGYLSLDDIEVASEVAARAVAGPGPIGLGLAWDA